jgi:hypothetical protein
MLTRLLLDPIHPNSVNNILGRKEQQHNLIYEDTVGLSCVNISFRDQI